MIVRQGFPLQIRSLAVTYSCMPEGHTTIGARRFHFRVRYGIGGFPPAMAARQIGSRSGCVLLRPQPHLNSKVVRRTVALSKSAHLALHQTAASRPKRIGCYMVKPHGQLVPVS